MKKERAVRTRFQEDTMLRVTMFLLACCAVISTAARAQDPSTGVPVETDVHTFTLGDALTYEPLEVPGFDPGLRLAVVHGNPMAESGDYTVRLILPAGYRFPPHYHPMPEHLTVLRGTFLIAMGTDQNPDAIEEYAPGAFLYFPPEQPHYGGAEGETEVQLHGEAPFKIILANTGT
jgi:quercetin dioxygenase-like cupin family protein